MADYSWTIETDANDPTITADAVLAEQQPTYAIGQEVTLVFGFENAGRVTDHVTRYEQLRDYAEWFSDNNVSFGTDVRGKPWYRYQRHPDTPVIDPMVKLVPGADVASTQSYWALFHGGEDSTRIVGGGEALAMDCLILAPGSRYSSRSDVEADLQAEM